MADFTIPSETVKVANSLEVPDTSGLAAQNAEISAEEAKILEKVQANSDFIAGTAASYQAVSKKHEAYAEQLNNVEHEVLDKEHQGATLAQQRQDMLELAVGTTYKMKIAERENLLDAERQIINETMRDSDAIEKADNLGILDFITSPIDTFQARKAGEIAKKNVQNNMNASRQIAASRAQMEALYTANASELAQLTKIKTAEQIQIRNEAQALKLSVAHIELNRKTTAEQMDNLKMVYGFNAEVTKSLGAQLDVLGRKRNATMQEYEFALREAKLKQNIVNIGISVEEFSRNATMRDKSNKYLAQIAKQGNINELYNTDGTIKTMDQVYDEARKGFLSTDALEAAAWVGKYLGNSNSAVLDSDKPYDAVKLAEDSGGNKLNIHKDLLELAANVDNISTSKGLTVQGQIIERINGGARKGDELTKEVRNEILRTVNTEVSEGNADTIFNNGFGEFVSPANFPDEVLEKLPKETAEVIKNLDFTPKGRPDDVAYELGFAISQKVADGEIDTMRGADVYYSVMQGYLEMTQANVPAYPIGKLEFQRLRGSSVPVDLTDSIANHKYFTFVLGKALTSRMKEVRPDGSIGNNFIPFTNRL